MYSTIFFFINFYVGPGFYTLPTVLQNIMSPNIALMLTGGEYQSIIRKKVDIEDIVEISKVCHN